MQRIIQSFLTIRTLATVLVSAVAPAAQAALTWEFNTVTKTASLNGTSDTLAHPTAFGSGSAVVWLTEITIPGGSSSNYPTTATATYNLPTPIVISNGPGNNIAGYSVGFEGDPNHVAYRLSINGSSPPAPATITGNGVGISYAGWNANVIAYFEGLTPSAPLIVPAAGGTIGESLTVYAVPAAVPEPASLGLLALCGTIMLRRRR